MSGKSALITGAGRDIGRGFAHAYTGEGARVAVSDIDLDRAQAVAAEIGDGAIAVHLDVSDQASINAAVARVEEAFGGIDILVNNAALFDLAPIVDISRESFDRLFSTNVAGTLFTLQAVAKSMIARCGGSKIIWWDGQGACLFSRRLERGRFVWPAAREGKVSLSPSQLSMLLEGIDWRTPQKTWRPLQAG